MTTNNRQHNRRVLIHPPAPWLHARPGAQVMRLPVAERPYDIWSALRFALLSLAVSLALIGVFAALFRSTSELSGAFLPGLTWW